MKIALITDQHLDGRKGNLAFWNYFQKFYDEIFFPTLEKEGVKVIFDLGDTFDNRKSCLLYTSPSPRDQRGSRMPSSA